MIRVFVTLFIGASILVSNFGYDWYTDTICTRTQYKPYINLPNASQEIQAQVGLHIGLRGINVTLREMDCGKHMHASIYVMLDCYMPAYLVLRS